MDNEADVIPVRQASPLRCAPVVNPRITRSREALLNAARELLLQGGPDAITVDAVAARSGVAKSTLYRHWATRDELVVDLFDHIKPPMIELDPSLPVVDALRLFGRQLAATVGDPEWQCMTPALLLMKLHQNNFAEIETRMQEQQRAALDAVLQRGIDEGVLRADATSDTSFTLLIGPFIMASLLGVVTVDDAFADAVTDHFIEGHRARAVV
ncbi:MAG: regulatory protein TetR [Ilumatobacteraceae bacterium]|nr:regulatory protein TetR [Ilumatobacteraceae bacterium]MCU1390977.1 regulatory protein TetR [Ilumatobacteraceae bacterium]